MSKNIFLKFCFILLAGVVFTSYAFAQQIPTSITLPSPVPTAKGTQKIEKTNTITRLRLNLTNGIELEHSFDTNQNSSTDKLYFKDYLGSTRLDFSLAKPISDTLPKNLTQSAISTNSNEASGYSYSPYGVLLQSIRPNIDRLFTSHRLLADADIYQAGARFYSPSLGIFLQPDTKEGANRYNYVGGNPVVFSDKTGKVTSYGYSQLASEHPTAATPCSQNLALCFVANVDLHTGIPSALAFLNHDQSGDWFDETLRDSNQFVSKQTALNVTVVNEAVGIMGGPISNVGKVSKALNTIDFIPTSSLSKFSGRPMLGFSDDLRLGGQILADEKTIHLGSIDPMLKQIYERRNAMTQPGEFKVLGRGHSTGTNIDLLPQTIDEQLLFDMVVSDIDSYMLVSKRKDMDLGDSRWHELEGWEKRELKLDTARGKVKLHFLVNPERRLVDDFKVKKRYYSLE